MLWRNYSSQTSKLGYLDLRNHFWPSPEDNIYIYGNRKETNPCQRNFSMKAMVMYADDVKHNTFSCMPQVNIRKSNCIQFFFISFFKLKILKLPQVHLQA